jgi:hypothetical protein
MKRAMRNYLAKKVEGKAAQKNSNRGFSTTELLLGAVLTTTVVMIAGQGVSNMIGASNASNARSDRRAEQNRSLDFIASEVRESTALVNDAENAANPSGFTPVSSDAVKVLMVNTAATGSTPVVYYVATPPAGTWKGPRVVYRWGPSFDAVTGNYANAGTPASWVSEVLIDNISSASTATSVIGSSAPTCANGGINSGDSGFNACVDAAGRTAQIFQDGQVAKVLGTSESYTASTNTGTRRTMVAPPSPSALPSGAISALPWTLTGGEVTTTQPLNMTVRFLGGDIVCGDPRYPIPTFGSVTLRTGSAAATTTNLDMTPGSDTVFNNVAANSTMVINGLAQGNSGSDSCDTYRYGTVSTNPSQVYALKNGQSVPSVPGFLNQASVSAILKSASANPATRRPIVTSANTVDLAPNQVIYLFELGTDDTASNAYDLQDVVVLATFQ